MPLPLKLLPYLARSADVSTRCDAAAGRIVGERDYVASFLATFRNLWRLLGGHSELHLNVLPTTLEKEIGCDFGVVLNGGNHFKLMYVEAKRAQAGWDEKKKPSKTAAAHYGVTKQISHFSDQIGRQAVWLAAHPSHFIAEMFLQVVSHSSALPPYNNTFLFDEDGSTFITHERARRVIHPPLIGGGLGQFHVAVPWSNTGPGGGPSGLEIALGAGGTHAGHLFHDFVRCELGRAIQGDWRIHLQQIFRERGQEVDDLDACLQNLGLHALLVIDGDAPPTWRE